uniref:Uncharacterized protein n=1 Tax=Rhizophora mucronata TaxID=61149 RepID=A0A2P2PGW3_RHIMU
MGQQPNVTFEGSNTANGNKQITDLSLADDYHFLEG